MEFAFLAQGAGVLQAILGQAEGVLTADVMDAVLAQCALQLDGATPVAGLLQAGAQFELPEAAARVLEVWPELELVGCTTAGTMSSQIPHTDDSIGLLLLWGEGISLHAAGTSEPDPQRAASELLAGVGSASEPVLALVFPVQSTTVYALAHALDTGLPTGCTLLGGVAGYTPPEHGLRVVHGAVQAKTAALLTIAGPLRVDVASCKHWCPLGPRAQITAWDGVDILEINGEPALDFLRYYLSDLSRTAVELPLALYPPGSEDFILRIPRKYDFERGAIRLAAPVPPNAQVQLSEAVPEEALASSKATIDAMVASAPTDGAVCLALGFSCGARRLVLGTRIAEESRMLAEAVPGTPTLGMISFGEIAPVNGRIELHNAMLAVALLTQPQLPASPARPAVPLAAPRNPSALVAKRLRRTQFELRRLEKIKGQNAALLRRVLQEVDHSRQTITAQNAELRRLAQRLEQARARSDALLHTILPADIAEELKRHGTVQPVLYPSATVLFTDFHGFTRLAAELEPTDLLARLDAYFAAFDDIVAAFGLERLKTIGDAYMCVSGVPTPKEDHAVRAVRAAWAMQQEVARRAEEAQARGEGAWAMRVGVHTGPLVAGVVGRDKFAFDVWGDTVNIASRMESTGIVGAINVSGATVDAVREMFDCTSRGVQAIKNAGPMEMFVVDGPRERRTGR